MAWRQEDVTQVWFEYLARRERELKDGWATGQFTAADSGESLQMNAQAVGEAGLLRDLRELDFEDFSRGEVNGNDEGN